VSSAPVLLTAYDVLASPARVRAPERGVVRVALVQEGWHADAEAHRAAIRRAVRLAAAEGARVVCLPELTLCPYLPAYPAGAAPAAEPEAVPGGPTCALAADLAAETGAWVHASVFEAAGEGAKAYNTAVCIAPDGRVVARARKLHLPVTAGYREDEWFLPGDTGYPVADLAGATFGFPTCWDQWFPEVARAYALAGADVLVYPSAIGSEPDHPAFDTEPLWEQVVRAQGVVNGTFMVVANRVGTEGGVTFYGSSFVSDPYGRVLVQAPRDRAAVLVADLDLDQRRDWLDLFPLLRTRRPDAYTPLLHRGGAGPAGLA
jgi:N-carbamoylputrescine amidase